MYTVRVQVISRISNEVYVQYDKETQTSKDRRFLFICQLVDDGRPPVTIPSRVRPNAPTDVFSNTITPSQTIIVQ